MRTSSVADTLLDRCNLAVPESLVSDFHFPAELQDDLIR
jgi:hypothetical protein